MKIDEKEFYYMINSYNQNNISGKTFHDYIQQLKEKNKNKTKLIDKKILDFFGKDIIVKK